MENKGKGKTYLIWGFVLLAIVVIIVIWKAVSGSSSTVAKGAGAQATTTVNGIGGLLTSLGKALGIGGTTTTPNTGGGNSGNSGAGPSTGVYNQNQVVSQTGNGCPTGYTAGDGCPGCTPGATDSCGFPCDAPGNPGC